MKLSLFPNTSLAAGAFLLASSFLLAQTTWAAGNMHPHHAASGQSSGQSGQAGIAVDHAGGNGVQRMAGTHNASGNSQAVQNKNSGENPLYESKGKANLKSNAGTSNVEYKDPEDMTTRYRPGNNKTTRNSIAVDHAGGNGVRRMDGGASAGAHAEARADAPKKKHLGGVKYEDRTMGGRNQTQMQPSSGRGSGR